MEATDFDQLYSRKVSNKALSDLDSSKQTHRDDPEVKDVAQATKAMVWELVTKVADDNKNYTVSDILDAGSYYEGTKIGFPDEFDFMIIFDIANLYVETGCAKGLVKLQLTNDSGPRDAEKNGAYVKRFARRFRELVTTEALDLLSTTQCPEYKSQFGSLTLDLPGFPVPLMLKWTNAQTSETKTIKVDLMPALRCPVEYVNKLLHILPSKHLHIIKTHGLYLVPKTCPRCSNNSCWHISFAQVESFLMTQLDPSHKAAYRILKYLIQIKQTDFDEVLGGITSYIIKNSLLHHVHTFGCKQLSDLGGCVINILRYIDQCYENLNMPLFFMNSWCMFRLGSLAYCKIESVTVVQNLTLETKGLLLNESEQTICFSKDTAAHCTWEFLVWIEYPRRYVTLILSILENATQKQKSNYHGGETSNSQTDTKNIISTNSDAFIRSCDSIVTVGTSHQPSVSLSFDFTTHERLITAMKNDRHIIYIYNFEVLKEQAEKLFEFEFKCVWNTSEVWPVQQTRGEQSKRLSLNVLQPSEANIYTRNRDRSVSENPASNQTSNIDRNCFEFTQETISGNASVSDKEGYAISIATVSLPQVTPLLCLVQFQVPKFTEKSQSPRSFFACLYDEISAAKWCVSEYEVDLYIESSAHNLNDDFQ